MVKITKYTFDFKSRIFNLKLNQIFGHSIAIKNPYIVHLGWVGRRSNICSIVI